jgi:hypothetical protein
MTDELPLAEDLAAVAELVKQNGGLFLRYSKGPGSDAAQPCSLDYESGVELPGLSVTTIQPEYWWPRPAQDWVARRICKYAELGEEEGRFPWLLRGRVVGYGPDHEPLVRDVEPVARISETALQQAKQCYEELFEVGRDSRSA